MHSKQYGLPRRPCLCHLIKTKGLYHSNKCDNRQLKNEVLFRIARLYVGSIKSSAFTRVLAHLLQDMRPAKFP